MLDDVDWGRLFVPGTPILEILIRGSVTYLMLFVTLRLVLKRESGMVGIADLLVVVLIAEAAQGALVPESRSIPDSVLIVLTIIGWNYILNWLGFRFPSLQRFLHPPALELVKEGRLHLRNMRHELITEEELMSQLRQQGVEDIAQVKRAFMEGDGHISVITYEDQPRPRGSPSKRQAG
jgi:uncharacterized membrane protein YcaP (DUF421 family)